MREYISWRFKNRPKTKDRRPMTSKTNCDLAMFEELLYPTFIAMSPLVVLERHQKIIDKYGIENFLKKEEFKRAREMYQTARYAIGMTAKTGNLFWITPGKRNETPDTYIIWKEGETKVLKIECVEVTTWEKHIETMFKVIEKKLNKYYPANFVVLVHINREGDNVTASYFADIYNRLKKCRVTMGSVRFWTSIKKKGEKDTLLGELYPSDKYTEFHTAYILNKYHSLPQPIIKIDVISGRSGIVFNKEDFDNKLPKIP